LSILFPGAYFKSQGLRVAYFDQRFDTEEELLALIKRSREIGVSAMTGYQSGQAADILIKAKQIKPEIITGVGGYHARICSNQVAAELFVDKVWTGKTYGEDLFPYDEQTKKFFERGDLQYMTSRGCPFGCRFCIAGGNYRSAGIYKIRIILITRYQYTMNGEGNRDG